MVKKNQRKKKNSPVRILLNPRNILIPAIIGFAVAGYMIYSSFNPEAFQNVHWSGSMFLFLFLAFVMVVTRDLGYMYRIRVLTNKEIKWRNAFDVIMLWEFASAISPSVVGGSGIAIFIVNREGINMGRSTAVVMITALLDELFYILMVPTVIFLAGTAYLFPIDIQKEILGVTLGTQEVFIIGYVFIVLLTSLISFGIFISPRKFKELLIAFTKLGFLKRWRNAAEKTGADIITTSAQLKTESFSFWAKAFAATLFSWTARFWTANFLILAFTTAALGFGDQMLIYARQLIMWVIMLISPTPGGTGIAELAFEGFLSKFIVPIEFAVAIAIIWRLLTYYIYLIVGSIVLPNWVRRAYLKRDLISFKK